MRSVRKLFILIIIAASIHTSCTKDQLIENPNDSIYAIKSVFGYGKTNSKFIYNAIGKISEYQSFCFCNLFVYDEIGRLVKQEIAADPDLYSSQSHDRSELMTSQNSTFTGYSIYEYDQGGRLKSIKNYFKKNNVFEYTSMNSFEYNGDNIVKLNLHNSENIITQFYTYEYDANRNILTEKYFSSLSFKSADPQLISETTFKFDNENNPFKIYQKLGRPGLYTNTNNIIESSTVLFLDTPGIDKYSTSKTNYEYNIKGFPVKVIAENSVYEYIY